MVIQHFRKYKLKLLTIFSLYHEAYVFLTRDIYIAKILFCLNSGIFLPIVLSNNVKRFLVSLQSHVMYIMALIYAVLRSGGVKPSKKKIGEDFVS